MENNRLGCINRDNNAVKNMKYIYGYYIEYLRGNVDNPRPEIFCRKNKDLQQPLKRSQVLQSVSKFTSFTL